ncbi:MAG: hypothetical protein U5N56_09460 [Candidatus Marinimicrobia bacterium]|nr:hypothetical protein [Candidatus Neomarinimicrobiota bacterium]
MLTVAGILWLLEFYLSVDLGATWVLYLSTVLMFVSWVMYMIQTGKIMRKQKMVDRR